MLRIIWLLEAVLVILKKIFPSSYDLHNNCAHRDLNDSINSCRMTMSMEIMSYLRVMNPLRAHRSKPSRVKESAGGGILAGNVMTSNRDVSSHVCCCCWIFVTACFAFRCLLYLCWWRRQCKMDSNSPLLIAPMLWEGGAGCVRDASPEHVLVLSGDAISQVRISSLPESISWLKHSMLSQWDFQIDFSKPLHATNKSPEKSHNVASVNKFKLTTRDDQQRILNSIQMQFVSLVDSILLSCVVLL